MAARSAAPPEAMRLRAASFDTSKLPKVYAPLDVKRTAGGWPALSADGFHLLEDGSRTSAADKIVRFRDADLGLALIVALDASGSMNGRPMRAIQNGLAQLVSRRRSEDRVAVLSFADDTKWETRWDTSEQATKDAFRNLQTRGNLTRLYDALEDANREFERQAGKDGSFPVRRCILVISDGHDEGSRTSLPQLLNDLSKTRVRLDAVGLAHSPLWLGSLRQLARTGYGEFQSAVTPEALTDLLGRGIDSLLDMPTLQFQAEHLEADGKTHQIGVEYSNGVRDQIAATMPLPLWRTPPMLYAAAGLLALLLLAGVVAWRFRSPAPSKPTIAAADVKPVPSPPPAPPPLRAATVAEPGSRVMRPAQTMTPIIRYGDALPTANTASKPARSPTVLAPGPGCSIVRLSLRAVAGPYAGQAFPVTEQEFWIGSAANNHLCVPADDGVSGNHLCIRQEQPFYRIYDNESLNNTWVNGRPIGREVTLIQPGDTIRVGASEFAVEAEE